MIPRSAKLSRNPSIVQSGRSASSSKTLWRCADSLGGLGLPILCGASRPLARKSLTHRTAVRIATPNRTDAARRLIPSSSTARTTRQRKSFDNGAAIHAGLPRPADSLNHISSPRGIPFSESALPATALKTRALSASRLALDLGVPSGRITDILNERRSITADTALRLGRYFGNRPQFWLDLQGQYDLAVIERERGEEITRRVRPADAA
jgi:antitoxin HigA-1